jgi:outer membrane receptor protein involved in Fe transport
MKQSHLFKKSALATAIATASLVSAPAAVSQQETIEEVLVTASVREQSALDIPYNISTMSGEDIAAQQITDQADLLRAISGVSVVDRGYRNSGTVNSIIIRGLNVDNGLNGDIQLNAHPTVSTYVDNTPLFANFVLKDLQRVEVLRGPQGTLYGSGALGGTVRYITNKPSTEEFFGEVSGEYSETEGSDGNNANANLMLNIPISDRMAFRGHIGKIDNDGMIDYVNAYQLNAFGEPMIADGDNCIDPRAATDQQVLYNGACYKNEEDADDAELEYARLALGFEATENLSLLLAYQTQEDDIGARRATTLGDNNQPVDSPLYRKYDDHESGQVLLEDSEREVDLYSLDVEWDLGFATLTSNSSYYEHEGKGNSDNGGLWVSGGEVDGTSRDWITNFGYAGWPRPAQRAERGYDDETFVQELRLISPAGEGAGAFDWVLGAYYMDQDRTAWQSSWNPGMNEFNDACRATGDPVCDNFWPRFYDGLTERDLEYVRDLDYEEYAVYGELTYHVTDRLRLTGGARWYDYEETNNTLFGYPLVEGWESSQLPETVDEDDDVLLKGNIAYDLNDNTMIYGTVSEGFRRGGANAVPSLDNGDPFGEPNADAIRVFGTDEVTNFEIGIKGRFENMTYTASAFYVDWDDPQLNTVTSWYAFYIATNGDSAVTQGIELEVDGTIMDSVNYRIGYTWVDAELDEDFISPQTGDLVAEDGATLPGTPEHVLSASLDKTWAIGDIDLVTRINAYYQDETENYINQESMLNETFDSFWLINASATLLMDNWQFVVFGKNLGDEEGVTGAFPSSHWSFDTGVFENWYGNGNRQMITQPRTVGASVSYRF